MKRKTNLKDTGNATDLNTMDNKSNELPSFGAFQATIALLERKRMQFGGAPSGCCPRCDSLRMREKWFIDMIDFLYANLPPEEPVTNTEKYSQELKELAKDLLRSY